MPIIEQPVEVASTWTLDSLKMLMDERMRALQILLDERATAQQEAVAAALAAVDKAITKADLATDKRFEAANAYREQLSAQAQAFMYRDEFWTAHNALAKESATSLHSLETRLGELDQRTTSRLDLMTGHGAGLHAGWAYLVGAVALCSTVISTVIIITTR